MPVYVIVGASRGLGYQFLKTISSQEPSNIIVGTVRTVGAVQEKVAADGLKNVHILHGDMDNHASLTTAAKKTAELVGGVVDSLIVNGAYFALQCYFDVADDFVGKESLFLDELKQYMHTNVVGTLFAFNAFIPLILRSSIKCVAAISSICSGRDFIFEGEDIFGLHYATSKAALNALVAELAAKYKYEDVLFVSLHPGWVATRDDVPKEIVEKATAPIYRFDKACKGPIPPAQSAEKCLRVIDALTQEQSGEFLSHHDNRVWIDER